MATWIGIFSFAISGALLHSAFRRRRRMRDMVRARHIQAGPNRASNDNAGARPASLDILRDVGPALVNLMLAYIGIKATLLFLMIGPTELFNLVDLAGFLSLLGAYGLWLSWRVKHRLPDAGEWISPKDAETPVATIRRGKGAETDGRRNPVSAGNAPHPGAGRRLGRV